MSTVLQALPGVERCPGHARPAAPASIEICSVVSNDGVAAATQRLTLHSPAIAGAGAPGQFVHVDCGMVLRRPFSISGIHRDRGLVDITYRLVGPGTGWLSGLRSGDRLSVIGPLGNGFSHPSRPGPALLVAGGIGVAPLLGWAKDLRSTGRRVFALVGARSRDHLVGLEALDSLGVSVTACTDDGSAGFRGTVCDLLHPALKRRRPAEVYCCGPSPVLRAVQQAAEELRIPCELSVEDRLACGVGACVGCAVRRRVPLGESLYFRACSDGPVFQAGDVVI
ncbi:MAG: dihydroorotate dehydrogenase electron transfer subunit [Bacillota bacterium]